MTAIVLLFWGLTAGSLLLALLLAIVLDGRRWIRLEWEFDDNAQLKAFQLSLLLIGLGVGITWIEEEGRQGALNILRWFPLYFLPLEFVQRYGKLDRVNLNSFFYFSRRRMLQDIKEGREVSPIQINTGYPYTLGVLCASATVEELPTYYWLSLSCILMLLVGSVYRLRGMKPRSLLVVMPIVVVFGWGIQWTMHSVHVWMKDRVKGMYNSRSSDDFLVDFTSTLAPLGDVQLNPKIEWRLWGKNPVYLRVASHNKYNEGRWTYAHPVEGFSSLIDSYKKHSQNLQKLDDGKYEFISDGSNSNDPVEIELRGTITHKRSSSVIPSAQGYYGISEIVGEGTYPEVNTMGTMQLENRDMVISYKLQLQGDAQSVVDVDPIDAIDFDVPEYDNHQLDTFIDAAGLREASSAKEVIRLLKLHFYNEFEYATNFDPGYIESDRGDLEHFLHIAKKGHCEYYATSAVLILRKLGIPARYAVGYVVTEKDGDLWNVRGSNAHAWARVYLDGEWTNVDLTPPEYRGVTNTEELGAVEWLREQISLLREDFFIWRQDPVNRSTMLWRVSAVAGVLMLWIAFRLWRSRSKVRNLQPIYSTYNGESASTILNKMEKWVSKRIGERNVGEPYGDWLQGLVDVGEITREDLNQAVELHQKIRFGEADENDAVRLQGLAQKIKQHSRK